ncbi:MAG: hypothetical protein WCF97_10650 [Nitrososphaeraceae archaeon]
MSDEMRKIRKTNKNIFGLVNCGNITIKRVTIKIEVQYSKIRLSSAKYMPRTCFGHIK